MLKPVPPSVCDQHGQPLFGRYAGAPDQIAYDRLDAEYRRSWWWERTHRKHWHYVALASDELFCAMAIVDVGWTNTAFAYVFDRVAKRLIASYSRDGIPGLTARLSDHPAAGAFADFKFGRESMRYEQDEYGFKLRLIFPDWELEAGGESLHVVPGMTAIARPQGGTVHTTYKSSAMPCEAGVRVGERFWKLKMIASTDHSLGFLARETAWQWASAHSLSLGWNLQSGYLGEQENVLWLDGNLIALGAVRFQFQAEQPEQAWLITSEDGLIDLVFQPEGVRAEDKNLIIAASRYQQPIGVFNGRVRAAKDKPWREVKNLVGVTENHFSRW